MIYRKLILITFFSILTVFVPVDSIQAGSLENTVTNQMQAASGRGEETVPPQVFIARIIKVVLGLVGTVFLVLLLMSGYWLVTSRGRSEQIKKARKTALRAVVGLIIIIMSYSVTLFVTEGIQQAALEGDIQQKNKPTTGEDIKNWLGF